MNLNHILLLQVLLISILLFLIIGSLLALITVIFQKGINYYILFAFLPIVIILIILYYRIWSKKTKWLSLGERFAGRNVGSEGKVWLNPYGKNRFFLYFVLFCNLIIIGNSWDSVSLGLIFTLQRWFQTSLVLLLCIIGMVKAGSNSKYWIIYLIVPFGIQFLSTFSPFMAENADEILKAEVAFLITGTRVISGFLLILNIFAYVVYSARTNKNRNYSG